MGGHVEAFLAAPVKTTVSSMSLMTTNLAVRGGTKICPAVFRWGGDGKQEKRKIGGTGFEA